MMADGKIWNQWNCSDLQASAVVGICDHTQTFSSLSAISHYHIAGQTSKRRNWWKHDFQGWGGGEGSNDQQQPENDVSKICIQNCIMTWIRVLSFCLTSVFMRIVWIRPRIWTSSSNCWAPNSPRIVGLSHVFSRIGNSGSSGWRRSSGGVLTTHEINAWQRVCWSGEGKGTVEITWPNGTAERSGGPQATWVAKDRLQ